MAPSDLNFRSFLLPSAKNFRTSKAMRTNGELDKRDHAALVTLAGSFD